MNSQPQAGTLLLRLAGPMQSWGVQSRFTIRDTGLEPSKSGVIGLICAALGRPRTAPMVDLAGLKMGVRVEQEGVLGYDYQTAQEVLKASGGIKETELSRRYYLADASFLVGLRGEMGLLRLIQAALRDPVWPLYLGRKAFTPGEPVWLEDGLTEEADLKQALEAYPWALRPNQTRLEQLRLVLEDPEGPEVRPDQPISFVSQARRFAPRRVRTVWMSL